MTKKTLSIVAGLALAIGASIPAYAQDATVKAHIPFAFSVSRSSLPAGDYTLLKLSESTWVVRNDGVRKAVITAASPAGAYTDLDGSVGKLVFTKYGETYFLSRVWCAGLKTSIAEPKPERAIEIQMTSSNQKPETVYVLASAR